MTLHQPNFEFTPHDTITTILRGADTLVKNAAMYFEATDDIRPAQEIAREFARTVTAELARYDFEIAMSKPLEDTLVARLETLARHYNKHMPYRVMTGKRSGARRRRRVGFHTTFATYAMGLLAPAIGGGYLALTSAQSSAFYDSPLLGLAYGILGTTPILMGSAGVSWFCTESDSEKVNKARNLAAFLAGAAVMTVWAVAKALDLGVAPDMGSGFQIGGGAVAESLWQTIKAGFVDPLNQPLMIFSFVLGDALLGGALVAFAKNRWAKEDEILAEKQPVCTEIEDQEASIVTRLLGVRRDGGRLRELSEASHSLRALIEKGFIARVRAEATVLRSDRAAKIAQAEAETLRHFLDA